MSVPLALLVLACSSGRDDPGGPLPDDTSLPDDSATPSDSDGPSLCPSGVAATDAPVIWTMSGSEVSFVDGTGASRDVFSFEGLSATPTNARAQAAGDHVAILDLQQDGGAALVLLGVDGSVVAQAIIPGAYTSDFWLGADSVTYSPGHEKLDAQEPWIDGVVLRGEGVLVLEGWIPKGPVVDGVLPVCATDDSACAWLDVATGKRSGSFPIDAWWTGKYVAWLDANDLVVATSTSERHVELGIDSVLDWNADTAIVGSVYEPHAVVSLDTGERVPIGALPDGWRVFSESPYCRNPDWKLTSDDRLLAVLRNDQVGQVWMHDPKTGTWDPIGSPLADVVYVGVWEESGTVQIGTVDPVETFCVAPGYEPTADALLGSTVQVLRPDGAIHWVDPDWAAQAGWANLTPPVELHSGATCALSSTGNAVVDLLTGDAVALAGSAAGWLD